MVSGAGPAQVRGSTPVGRPRRFDDDTERGMIIDAALRVMGERDGEAISLTDVLGEAGLSTRAFYRHFESKEALFEALMLREAASFGRSLTRVVDQAPNPVAAVDAWLERYLDAFYEPRRARRVTQLLSVTARASRPSAQMMTEMRRIASTPLAGALHAGHVAGVLHSPTPMADAFSIHDLVNACRDANGGDKADRAATRAHVVRFAWPALGLAR